MFDIVKVYKRTEDRHGVHACKPSTGVEAAGQDFKVLLCYTVSLKPGKQQKEVRFLSLQLNTKQQDFCLF